MGTACTGVYRVYMQAWLVGSEKPNYKADLWLAREYLDWWRLSLSELMTSESMCLEVYISYLPMHGGTASNGVAPAPMMAAYPWLHPVESHQQNAPNFILPHQAFFGTPKQKILASSKDFLERHLWTTAVPFQQKQALSSVKKLLPSILPQSPWDKPSNSKL